MRTCRKCANHGKMIAIKDHKKECEYKFCNCDKCKVTIAVKIRRITRAQPLPPRPSTSSTHVPPVAVAQLPNMNQGN